MPWYRVAARVEASVVVSAVDAGAAQNLVREVPIDEECWQIEREGVDVLGAEEVPAPPTWGEGG